MDLEAMSSSSKKLKELNQKEDAILFSSLCCKVFEWLVLKFECNETDSEIS